jgi:putative hydrolase of the HAD superfamily
MDAKIKYILFDVSGTLLQKPSLYKVLMDILVQNGYKGTLVELKQMHKILSEIIHFPDRTNKVFYKNFNENLLFSLGIIPNENVLEEIYSKCSYLPWEKFEDTIVLSEICLPMGILSNFNSSLKEKLYEFFGPVFKDIIVSEDFGIAKPAIEIYNKAIEIINFSPENILYIGDSLKLDIQPALTLGIKTLLIDRDNFFPNSEYSIKNLNQILNHI